jgi:hypothetical protein
MKKFGVIVVLLIVVGFGFGLTQLFSLRFATGDIYPPYSSFRTDPLGAKVLYEGFDRVVKAERNFKPMPKLENGRDTALLILGLQPSQLRVSPGELKDLEHYVVSGGRLVLTFFPVYTAEDLDPARHTSVPPSNSPPAKPVRSKRPAPPTRQQNEEEDFGLLLHEQWKFGLAFGALDRGENQSFKPQFALKQQAGDLPPLLLCHTALYFDQLNPAWKTLYARTNGPVIIERKLGSGSIVVVADSYPFSNEALLKERQPKLLAWFTGGARAIIFDETHLGVQENRGVAALARKYRLHGFAAGLLLLAGLFVWRSSFSLIPPYEEELQRERGELISGKEAAAGFTNLLRRNISARDLLKACLEEWNKSCRHRVSTPRLEKVQAIIDSHNASPESARDPVTAYRQITEALARTPPKKRD